MKDRLRRFIFFIESTKVKIFLNIYKLKIYQYYSKLTKDYIILCFLLQILIIIVIVLYLVEGSLFIQKVYLMLSITMFMLGIRYMYICILKSSNGNCKYPIYDNAVLKQFFIRHKRINEICYLVLKYVNLGRVMLIVRNGIMIKLRYIRYISYRNNVLEYWIKIEKFLMYIIYDIMVQYLEIIINDVYLPGKKQIVSINIKYLLLGRVQFLIFICLGKGPIPLIVVILLVKLVKLVNKLCVNGARSENFCLGILNMELMQSSYIFRNLKFSKKMDIYIGYKKVMPIFHVGLFSDELYQNNKRLQYMDIYGGLNLNYIAELNILIKNLFDRRIFVEYCLINEQFSMYRKQLVELQGLYLEMFRVLNLLVIKLRKGNASFGLNLHWVDYHPSIELVINKVILNDELNNIKLEKYVILFSELAHMCAELRVTNDNILLCSSLWGSDFMEEYNRDAEGFKEYIYNTYIGNIFIPEILKE